MNTFLVLTPTLGLRSSLHQTIESVYQHGVPGVHHFLVGPPERLAPFQELYPWIDVLPQPSPCNGVYGALNYALSSLGDKYSYFCYLNDDDCWASGFDLLLSSVISDPSLDLVYGRTAFVADNRIVRKGAFFPFPSLYSSLARRGVPLFTQQSLVVRTSCVMSSGGFPEAYPLSADTRLWGQIIDSGAKVMAVRAICSYYSLDGHRLSTTRELLDIEASVNRRMSGTPLRQLIYDFGAICLYRIWNLPIYLRRLGKL